MPQIGSYQIVDELGRGGMGVVFRGFDPAIGRPVAIKILHPTLLESTGASDEALMRFKREAAAAGRLSHPNIVTIYHVGEEKGWPYLVMELIAGRSLRALISDPAVDAMRKLGILRQIASGLDYAHSQGVIHRDIKPDNILVRNDDTVKITDFGIARLLTETVTRTGSIFGTPAFMAPEQIHGAGIDGRADQFSLAVLAYYLLTGRKPFDAPTEPALLLKILHEDPAPAPELPAAARKVLHRALAKSPTERYPDCVSFASELNAAATAREEGHQSPEPVQPHRRDNDAVNWIVGAVAVLAFLIVGAVAQSTLNSRPREPMKADAPEPAKKSALDAFSPNNFTSVPLQPKPVPSSISPQEQAPATRSRADAAGWERVGGISFRLPANWSRYSGGGGRVLLVPNDARPPTTEGGVQDVAIAVAPEADVGEFGGGTDAVWSKLTSEVGQQNAADPSWHSDNPFIRVAIGPTSLVGVSQEGVMRVPGDARTVFTRRIFYFMPPRWLSAIAYAATSEHLFHRYRADFDNFLRTIQPGP